MPDVVVYVAMVLGCSLAAVGGARLLGSRMWLDGVIAAQDRDGEPRGVREADADDTEAAPAAAEIVELHVRGYTHPGDPHRG